MVIWFCIASYLVLHHMALGKINITQGPNILPISNGDAARINCQWNKENSQRVRVQWRRHISSTGEDNGTLLCSILVTEQNRILEVKNNTRTCNVTNNTALLTIDGVTQEDEGLYTCEVIIEIPKLMKARGNGTQLYVQEGNNVLTLDIRFWYLTILLIIPILISVCCYYCKRKKEQELFRDHIYGNVKRNRRSSKNPTCKRDTEKTTA